MLLEFFSDDGFHPLTRATSFGLLRICSERRRTCGRKAVVLE